MQYAKSSLLGALRHASLGRLSAVMKSQARTVITVPAATVTHLNLRAEEQRSVEILLTAVLDHTDKKDLKTYEDKLTTDEDKPKQHIFTPNKLNKLKLLSGPGDMTLALDARRVAIAKAAASFAARRDLHIHAMQTGEKPDNRHFNPLSALQSSPGGGKSTLLDMIGQLSSRSEWTPEMCKDEEMCGILNRSIPISITFNTNTSWHPGRYDKTHEHALGLRIMLSFFVCDGAELIENFAERMPADILPYHAIQACLAHMHMHEHLRNRKDNILLLVDETRKTRDSKGQVTELLKAMGRVLDTSLYNQVNILCTTLDSTAFFATRTDSGRPVIWSSLDKLSQGTVEDMFLHAVLTTHKQHLHKLPKAPLSTITARNTTLSKRSAALSDKIAALSDKSSTRNATLSEKGKEKNTDKSARTGYLPIESSTNDADADCYVLPPAVRIAISDCAGHPRSLEKVQEVFLELLWKYESAEDWASKNSLKELRDGAIKKMSTFSEPSPEAVRVALEGRPLSFKALVGDKRYSELIAEGMFLNTSLEPFTRAVPKLSMLSLLLHKSGGDSNESLANCIEQIAKQEEEAVCAGKSRKLNTLEGTLFELFIARWLELRLRVADKPVTISEILHLPEATDSSAALERTFPARKVRFTHLPEDNLATLLDKAPDKLDASDGNKIVLLGKGDGLDNPAFDIVAVLQDDKQRRVALFLETRFSVAAGTRTEEQDDIDHKLRLFDRAAEQVHARLGLEKSDIVYVSVLNRSAKYNSADIREHKHFLKENVVILDRESLQTVLTHSLADRALFLMDLRLE